MGEVQLLDRVLLKLGLAQDDAELESFIKVYLCPVLLKTGGYSLPVDALQSCFEHALVGIRVIPQPMQAAAKPSTPTPPVHGLTACISSRVCLCHV